MELTETAMDIMNSESRPRLGFLGAGWIGLHRLRAIAASGMAEITAVADSNPSAAAAAAAEKPGAVPATSLEDLLAMGLDGVVIATPTALHAAQAVAALESGLAVFCQKPLGRTEGETLRVLRSARDADRLLAVDMSYRFARSIATIKDLAAAGEIGAIYAADLAFHNAYGPDKPWYYERRSSGGGCVIDLAIHLVDLALWMLDFPEVASVSSRLFAAGKPLDGKDALEDYAVARLELESGAVVNLASSWRLPAGRDAVIRAVFYGTKGGLAARNVRGSFYDFRAERYSGTSRQVLDEPPDAWGGRAAVSWARRLAESRRYDAEIESAGKVARIIDAIYGNDFRF